MNKKNIYKNIPPIIKDELFEIIDQTEHLKIERIISDGHHSLPNFWYDQEMNELVFLLQGSAVIEYENGTRLKLEVGDYVKINAHEKHRVVEISKTGKTIWLAIHY